MNLVAVPDPEPNEKAVELFVSRLGASREAAQRLAIEGHSSIEEIAYVPMDELRETKLEQSLLDELRAKARRLLDQGLK
jgi:transcription termination/antitermination protein NusA